MQPLQALALLPLALAAPLLETRQTCPTPTTFQISRFLTFTPDATQNPNGNSSISFTFSDSTTGVTTTCSRTGGLSGPGDATRFYPCANPNVSFLYAGVGQPFDVEETFNCTSDPLGQETVVANSSSIPSEFCFGVVPPFPLGAGTECETVPNDSFELAVTGVIAN